MISFGLYTRYFFQPFRTTKLEEPVKKASNLLRFSSSISTMTSVGKPLSLRSYLYATEDSELILAHKIARIGGWDLELLG